MRDAFEVDMALMAVHGYAMLIEHTVSDAPFGDRLGENTVPTLLVAGERERRFEPL